MKIIPDTNTIVSGLLWNGAGRAILDLARAGKITLYTNPALIAELEDVLGREKFTRRLQAIRTTANYLSLRYASLVQVVHPQPISPVVLNDPDDDIVIACALSAKAEAIVSGDSHLLNLKEYQGILILTANKLLEKFE